MLLCTIGLVYTISSTAIPLKALAGFVNTFDGITIEGVDGSITSGFKASKVSFNKLENSADFLLENLIVEYTLKEMMGTKKRLHIKNINLDKLVIIGSNSSEDKDHSEYKENRESDKKDNLSNNDLDLLIDRVSIKNVLLKEHSKSKGFTLKLLTLKNLKLIDGSFNLDKIELVSSLINLSGYSKSIGGGNSKMQMNGTISSDAIDKLITDLPFEVIIDFEGFSKKSISVSAYSGKMTLDLYSDKVGSLVFNDMSFADSFQNDWPITWLNGAITMPVLTQVRNEEFKPQGLIQLMTNGKKYDVIQDSYRISTTEIDGYVLSFKAQGGNSKLRFDTMMPKKGKTKINITEI